MGRTTLKESVYILEEDSCKIRYQIMYKKVGKKDSKKRKNVNSKSTVNHSAAGVLQQPEEGLVFDGSDLADDFDLGAKIKDVLQSMAKIKDGGKKQKQLSREERQSVDLNRSVKL